MHVLIDNRSGIPIFKQIFDHIKYQILADKLQEGEQLMPVRDLALVLKINPMTISKSYSLLEREGFVERRRGVGLFVQRPPGKDQATIDAAYELLRPIARKLVDLGVTHESASHVLKELMNDCNSNKKSRG